MSSISPALTSVAVILRAAGDRDLRAARPGEFGRGLDRAHGVGEQPGVVIVLGVKDAPGHDLGVLRPG
jgi:hypothetical protein